MRSLINKFSAEQEPISPPIPNDDCYTDVEQSIRVNSDTGYIDWEQLASNVYGLGVGVRAMFGEQIDLNYAQNMEGCSLNIEQRGGGCGAYLTLSAGDDCGYQATTFHTLINAVSFPPSWIMLDIADAKSSTTNSTQSLQSCIAEFIARYTEASKNNIDFLSVSPQNWIDNIAGNCSIFYPPNIPTTIFGWAKQASTPLTAPPQSLFTPCFHVNYWEYSDNGTGPAFSDNFDVSCLFELQPPQPNHKERTAHQPSRRLLNAQAPAQQKSTPAQTPPANSWLSSTYSRASNLLSNTKAAVAQGLITSAVDVGAKVAQVKYGISERTAWIGRNVAYYGAMFGLKFMQRAAMAESEELDCQQTMQEAAVDTAILGGINAGLHVSERLGKWAAQKLNDAEWVRSGKCVKAISERLHYLSTGYQMGTSDDLGAQIATNIAVGAAAQVAGKAALDAVLLPGQPQANAAKATP